MRIAYLVNQYPKVSHTFIRREVLALESLGLNVERIALRGWDAAVSDPVDMDERARTRYILRNGVACTLLLAAFEVVRRPAGGVRALVLALRIAWNGDRTVFHHLVSVVEGVILARWARQLGIEHVHAHFGTNSTEVAMLANAYSGLPYSFTVHGPDEWDRPEQLKIREKVRNAEFVVAISQYTKAQMFRWILVGDAPKVHVVHCGLSDEYFEEPVSPMPEGPVFVCVGRLCAAKGQHLLVDAVATLRESGVHVRLVLVGDGESREVIEGIIRDRDLGSSVKITGWASDSEVRGHIAAARALILPSLAEGLPVVIMEAMALGRPVISTYIAGIPELVLDGVVGWLVPASDSERLTKCMVEVVQQEESQWEAMSIAARERVWARHRSSAEAKKLRDLFLSTRR